MRKVSLKRMLVATILLSALTNMVHPVTPQFLKELNLSNNMFGWVYAGMATTNFLFSPFWAKVSERIGTIKVTVVSVIFYGIAQLLFGYSTTVPTIMFARLVGGFFIGGIFVAQLMYIVNNAENEKEKGDALVLNATMQIVAGTIGFLIGGLVGNINTRLAFVLQFFGLILNTIFIFLFIDEKLYTNTNKFELSDINPFKSLNSEELKANKYLRLILIVSALASSATVLYDQTFNYYMADHFNFLPSVNGIIKAITGISALISTSTITLWIIRNKQLENALANIFIIVSVFILLLINIEIPYLFLGVNIIYFTVHASYLPIIQKVAVDSSSDSTSTIGTLNSLRSLGMILGAVLAGQAYQYYKKLPFILSIVIFLISALLTLLSKSHKKSNI